MKTKGLPRIGQRIIRSAAGVLICYLIYFLRGETGIPFYSMIAAVWCIQPYTGKTLTMAGQRTTGTLIGAVYGLAAILLEIYVFDIYNKLPGYLLNVLFVIPVLYTTVLLKKQSTAFFSCVVFLSIAVNHLTDPNSLIFVFNRVTDTLTGIVVGVVVNSARLPRKRVKDCLFAASLDDMLTPVRGELSPYSKVEINRMLESGMKFTISTARTPASVMKPLEGVELNMPVIVMGGAALYDVNENTFLNAYVISGESCGEIVNIVRDEGMNCFISALCDDTMIIYYRELINPAEKNLFERMKKSPCRNYIRRDPYESDRPIYIMILDETKRINGLYEKMLAKGFGERFRILCFPAEEYKGFSYIKIYNKNSCPENMIRYLMDSCNIDKKLYIGAGDEYDVQADSSDLDSIIRTLRKKFEPISFSGK